MSYIIENIAYRESLKTTDTKQHFGCVITKNRRILSRGHNFHAFGEKSCCCHAEMDAIYRHLKMVDRWDDFKTALRSSYRMTGILSRLEGRAS